LERDWPEEVARYEQLFAARAYLPAAFARPLQERVRASARSTPVRHVPSPARRSAPALRQLELAIP
jgi:hypothetical protein